MHSRPSSRLGPRRTSAATARSPKGSTLFTTRPAVRLGVGELAACLEALGGDLVRRLAVKHALATGVVGGVEATQQLLELLVGPDGDAEHLAADPAVEALHHAIRLR